VIPLEWVDDASRRLRPYVVNTPTTYDEELNLFFKWENHQGTGSFKLRGALNKVLSLQDWECRLGIVTCSAGNHGQGVAFAAGKVNASCIVFASEHAVPAKIDAMRALGAEVVSVAGGFVEAEGAAIRYAQETGKMFISPYNDGQVIAGQATVIQEVLDEFGGLESFKSIVVPVGGGGLISGIGTVINDRPDRPKLIGVQSEASSYAFQLLSTSSQEGVVETESIADGLAGEIDHDSITIPIMKKCVDEVTLVSEEQIKKAICYAWKKYGEKVEGSAAVSLAARLAGKIQALPALSIVTGGNIQPELFAALIRQYEYQV